MQHKFFFKKGLKLQDLIASIVLLSFGGLVFFSIFAEKKPFNYFTIVFAVLMICSIILFVIKYGSFKIDIFSYLLLSFIAIITVSQLVNGLLLSFPKNIILVPLMAFFIYQFSKNFKNKKMLFYVIVMTGIGFSCFFFAKYHNQILSLSFSSRIGSEISDQNYLGEFFALFSVISFSFVFGNKNKVMLIISILSSILFFILILYTGSISNTITTLFVACVSSIVFTKGKKRLFISIGVAVSIALFIILLQFDFMAYFRNRIVHMFNTFISGDGEIDNSSAFRYEFFLNGLRMFLRGPLFGFGYYMTAHYSATSGSFTHNNIAELLGCHGIFSLLIFEVLLILPLVNESKKSPQVFVSILYIFIFQLFLVQYNKKIEYILMAIAFSHFEIKCVPTFEIRVENKKIKFIKTINSKIVKNEYYEVNI